MTGRWINADGLVSTGTGILGHNMFAYCDNNPVMKADPSGCTPDYAYLYSVAKEIVGGRYFGEWPAELVGMKMNCQTLLQLRLAAAGINRMPIEGATRNNDFPYYTGTTGKHTGTDFSTGEGTKVHAATSGVVTVVSTKINFNTWGNDDYMDLDTYGTYIQIKSDSDDTIMTYAHLSSVNVSVGQHVIVWDVIGLSGDTGRSKAPHLHFGVKKDGCHVNPYDYLP